MAGTFLIEASPEPRREKKFKEVKLPDEPASDVKVTTEGGLVLRERVKRYQHSKDVAFLFSYTRLNEDGSVMLDGHGQPIIADPHEVSIDGEAAAKGDLAGQLRLGREVALARAVDTFQGLDALPKLMQDRLR